MQIKLKGYLKKTYFFFSYNIFINLKLCRHEISKCLWVMDIVYSANHHH